MLKRTPSEQIAAAIRAVYQGYSQLGPTIALKVFAQLKSNSSLPKTDYHSLLTKRELEVLKLIGEGKNNQEIALFLHITEGTVKNYVTRIMAQLNLRDRIQAVLWAKEYLCD